MKEGISEKTRVDAVTHTLAEAELESINTISSEPDYLSGAGKPQTAEIEAEVAQCFPIAAI